MIRARKDENNTNSGNHITNTNNNNTAVSTQAVAVSPAMKNIQHDNTIGMVNSTTKSISATSVAASPSVYRYQQPAQRTGSNSGNITKTSPPTFAYNAAAVSTNNNSATSSQQQQQQHAPSATGVSSFSKVTSVSSSLKYYNDLLQQQMYGLRKVKKKSKLSKSSHDSTSSNGGGSNIWTVQMPKRMLWSTMSVFLLIPILIFAWKEMHIQSMDHNELRSKKYNGQRGKTTIVIKKDRNSEYVTWMANHLSNEDEEEEGLNVEIDTISRSTENETWMDETIGHLQHGIDEGNHKNDIVESSSTIHDNNELEVNFNTNEMIHNEQNQHHVDMEDVDVDKENIETDQESYSTSHDRFF